MLGVRLPKQNAPKILPEASQISAVIEQCEEKSCDSFADAFMKMCKDEPDRGWELLRDIFRMRFIPDNAVAPYDAVLIMDGKRSMIPSDLSDAQLNALDKTLEVVEYAEYTARIADLMWLSRRDVRRARQAVEAYIASGVRLEDPEHWTLSMERYERGLRLARQLDSKGELLISVLSHLESRVHHYNGSDPLYFTYNALDLLCQFKFGDFVKLVKIVDKIISRAKSENNYRRTREHLEMKAKLLKLEGETDAAESALVEAAETFSREAEIHEGSGSNMVAHSILEEALKAYRNRPSLRSQIPDLKRRYAAAGEKLLGEMKSIQSDPIDISESIQKTKEIFRSMPLDDALYQLGTLVPLLDPHELEKSAQQTVSDSPMLAIIDADIHDSFGRKVGVRPSVHTEDPAQLKKAYSGFMEQEARFHRELIVSAHLVPALQQIMEEHEIDCEAIKHVLDGSSLLSEDRMDWFCRAIVAGFQWEFAIALHMLIPQFENALRELVRKSGGTPENVDAEGVVEVWGYERLLKCSEISEIFGDAVVYELRSLLVERLGPNLRHSLAHGIYPPDYFNSFEALYLWWLIFKIVVMPTPGMKAFIERIQVDK